MQRISENRHWLGETRRAPIWLGVGLIAVHVGFTLFMNLIAFEKGYFDPVYDATSGWVNATLCANLIGLIIEVAILLRVVGRVDLREVGVTRGEIVPALKKLFLYWLAVNLIALVIALLMDTKITFNSGIVDQPNIVFGSLLGQVFGNALLEEIVFRGFLFTQVYLLLSRVAGQKLRLMAAVGLSQTIFALIHIPNRIYSGYAGLEYVFDFVQLVLFGALFALIYYLTKNLLFVVGVHALLNAPLIVIDSEFGSLAALIGIVSLLGILSIRGSHQQTPQRNTGGDDADERRHDEHDVHAGQE